MKVHKILQKDNLYFIIAVIFLIVSIEYNDKYYIVFMVFMLSFVARVLYKILTQK